jgi:hypothetical protein
MGFLLCFGRLGQALQVVNWGLNAALIGAVPWALPNFRAAADGPHN